MRVEVRPHKGAYRLSGIIRRKAALHNTMWEDPCDRSYGLAVRSEPATENDATRLKPFDQ